MRTTNWTRGLVAVAVLAACGCSKLTYERYQTIHDGASRDAVRATLGKPSTALDQKWLYNDFDREITCEIYFEGDKVIGSWWSDPNHPMEGKSPHVNKPGEAEHSKVQKIE